MESLSIKKTGKAFLAVALVIFMLVALLGLSLYGHTVAAASADGADLVISAEFTASSATAHTDSTATKKYYNQLASGDGSLPLAVNDTFTVTYSFAVNNLKFTGAKALDLTNAGFDIVSVTVNGVNLTTGSGTTSTSNGVYTMSADKKSKIGFDGNGSVMSAVDDVVVVYKLTEAIATYANKTIGLSGQYSVLGKKLQDVASSTVAVYVRSTASITTTSPAKTYDSTAVTTSTTFTPAVSDASDTSNRSAIVTTWSSGSAPFNAGSYNVAVSTAANDYYEATAYNTDFTIAQKAVTLTAVNKTTEHGDALATLTWTGDSGFYAADGVTVSASTTAATTGTNSNVGTYPITLATSATPTSGYNGLANYAITYEHAQTSGSYGVYEITRKFIAVPTVTIFNNGATTGTTIAVAGSEDVNYNGLVYSFDYAAASDNAYSGVASPAASKNVGTYVLTLTVGSNYRWGANVDAAYDVADKVFTYVVKKVDLHVSLNHDAITYRDAVPTSGYSISLPTAAVGGETVAGISLTQSDFDTNYDQYDVVGSYAITVSGTTKSNIETAFSNYNVIYDTADKLTVNKYQLSAVADWVAYTDSDSVVYDKAAHGIVAVPAEYTIDGAVICSATLTGGDNSNGTQTHVSGNEAAVTLTATFALRDATDGHSNSILANYALDNAVIEKDITITRKAVTITAADKSTTYGSAAPAFTSDAGSVLISGDTYTTTGSMTSAYTATAGNANRVVNTYAIVPSGWENNDYAISYTNGTLTVNKKVVTFTWSATQTWVYDAASHTITATVVGAEYSEDITVATYSGDASATNVGNYSRTVTSLSDDDNYAITTAGTETETYSITKAPITITITPATSLVYTSVDKTVFTVTVSGMIGTETLTYTFDGTNLNEADGTFTLSNASETFTGMLAQDYDLTLTAVANGTGLVANYDYTLPAKAENTIAKATFTPGAISYSGATVSWAAVTGTQGSDVITFTYTVNKGATEKQSSTSTMSYTASATGSDYVLAISFAGDRAANYNTIADQALLEVFSVTLTDTAYNNATFGHPHNGDQIASVTQYAFAGQTVPGVSDWAVAGYDFQGWYVDATDRTSAQFNAANAVNATATYVASWDVVTYNVTYKYKLAGADSWETYKSGVVTTYWTALEAVPSITWFSNVGWNDAEAMNGATKTILDYTSDRTYYTVYSFNVKNGDVDGNGSITAADATLYRQYNVGGYAVDSNVVATIAAAWTIADQFTEGVYSFNFTADTYFLQPVSDVDADGEESTNDIFYIINSQIDNSDYAAADDASGVVIKIRSVTGDKVFAGIMATSLDSVKVAGETATYDYEDGVLTLNTALTGGQKLEVIIGRVKYVYQA